MKAAKECCRRTFCARSLIFMASASIIFWNELIKRTKTTADAVVLIFGEVEEFVGGAFENLAEGFDIFIANGFRFVVDHAVEILIAHPQLVVEPVFRFAPFLQQGQNI